MPGVKNNNNIDVVVLVNAKFYTAMTQADVLNMACFYCHLCKYPAPTPCKQTLEHLPLAQYPLLYNYVLCAQHHQLCCHHNADTVFEPALFLQSHSDPRPTNAIHFVVPNACADAIRQQPADRWLKCRSRINLRSQVQILLHLDTTPGTVATLQLLHNSTDILLQ